MKQNILLIGFGYHCRRIYYPILSEMKKYNIIIIDKKDQEENILNFLAKKNLKPREIILIENFSEKNDDLPEELVQELDKIIQKFKIKGIIISTDPLYHKHYAKWALKRNLSILMDKPISVHKNMSTIVDESKKLNEDFKLLNKLYNKRKKSILFSIVSQRRFHKGFQKVRELIKEVFEETNCPITSIGINHSDGQWRFPTEIIDIDYHSFNHGFGKCSHSGYHFFDIINFFFEVITDKEKKPNNVDIYSNFLRPLDFLEQINFKDYNSIFKDFKKYNKYSKDECFNKMKNFGEIDAFLNFSFKHNNNQITLGSINLIHNSFSQRGKIIPNKDFYKGNGRVRHETYTIQQGPFQCIQIISFQSKEVKKKDKLDYSPGGEYHFDIMVFRNNTLFKKWKSYKKISLKDLQKGRMSGYSRGHQEDARRLATLEFLEFLDGKKKKDYISDFTKHCDTVRLMAGVYKSAALKFNNKNPLVNIPYGN